MNSVIELFYEAFQQLDVEKMVTCYHDDITFSDPAFGILRGDEACNMWRMLCRSQKNKNFDLSIQILLWMEFVDRPIGKLSTHLVKPAGPFTIK